jgi:hypothetical protein
MNLVLAIEPDSSHADPLGSVVHTKLGAELVIVTSAYAAIVAMNQRVPDLVLFGREVSQDQRVKIATHLRSLADSSQVKTLEIPSLASTTPTQRSGFANPFRRKDAGNAGGEVASFERIARHVARRGREGRGSKRARTPAVAPPTTHACGR